MRVEAEKYRARRAWTAEVLNRIEFFRVPSGEIVLRVPGFEQEFGKLLLAVPASTSAAIDDARDLSEAIHRASRTAFEDAQRDEERARERAARAKERQESALAAAALAYGNASETKVVVVDRDDAVLVQRVAIGSITLAATKTIKPEVGR